MSWRAPALYLITQRDATAGRSLVDVVARALSGGGDYRLPTGRLPMAVCLRDKELPGAELLELARALRAVTRAAHADFFVNSRLDVALAADADGIHLPAQGIPIADVRGAAPNLRVGLSTHTSEEVALAARAGADFVVFGPIFSTPSKLNILEPRGVTALANVTALQTPVLALGGITPDRALLCRNAGAAGVACIRAVLSAPDPAHETRSFLASFVASGGNIR